MNNFDVASEVANTPAHGHPASVTSPAMIAHTAAEQLAMTLMALEVPSETVADALVSTGFALFASKRPIAIAELAAAYVDVVHGRK